MIFREIEAWVRAAPTGQYARWTWFLYEWLTNRWLDLLDATRGAYAGILDPDRQFAVTGETVTRHRVRNNLPGTPDFCPLVRRTPQLNALLGADLAGEARAVVQRTAPDLMARAAAFLLLEDSRASYVIEGERPPQDRLQRWGQAIGEAGRRPLTREEGVRRDAGRPLRSDDRPSASERWTFLTARADTRVHPTDGRRSHGDRGRLW